MKPLPEPSVVNLVVAKAGLDMREHAQDIRRISADQLPPFWMKSSDSRGMRIPAQLVHWFRWEVVRDSGGIWSRVPVGSGPVFWGDRNGGPLTGMLDHMDRNGGPDHRNRKL